MLHEIMKTLPLGAQMQIFDNVIDMNSIVENVKRGANIITTRVYSHAAIEGEIAWNKRKTGVSVNDILCVLDSISALHIMQVHAIEHCMNVLQDFMIVLNKHSRTIKYSLLYGDLASFIVTFGLFHDYAEIKYALHRECKPPVDKWDVCLVNDATPDDGSELTSVVDNAFLNGKKDLPNYHLNMFKGSTQYRFPAPANKRYAKTAAVIMHGMNHVSEREMVTIKCNNMRIDVPAWVLQDKPGVGKRPIVCVGIDQSSIDRLYGWFQDVYAACRNNVKKVGDCYFFDTAKADVFKGMHIAGAAILKELESDSAPGAPKKKKRKGSREPLNGVVIRHNF